MTHATITTQLEMDGVSIEFDGDYWRYEDDIVTDLTLCFMRVTTTDENGKTWVFDLLQGLDKPARNCVERNLFKIPGLVQALVHDIATQGEDLHIEPDYDPKMDY